MDAKKRKALEAKGWKVGTVQELLDLTQEDVNFIEMKLALARDVKDRRARKKLSQTQLGARMESSQSGIARMEKGQASLDMLVRAMLVMGASNREIGRSIGAAEPEPITFRRVAARNKRVWKVAARKRLSTSSIITTRNMTSRRPTRRKRVRSRGSR
jgi:transcriptional regulator with XRE-family HTH domain